MVMNITTDMTTENRSAIGWVKIMPSSPNRALNRNRQGTNTKPCRLPASASYATTPRA